VDVAKSFGAVRAVDDVSLTATVGGLQPALARRQSSVTQLVRRVENLGLVSRELSGRDARVRHLRLTEEGERRLAKTVSRLGKERARLLAIESELAPHQRTSSARPRR
jgi:DNA-binding MarR family transcriptional regulator